MKHFSIVLFSGVLLYISGINSHNHYGADVEDNEFAEFEDFGDEIEEDFAEPADYEEPASAKNLDELENEIKDDADETWEDEFADMEDEDAAVEDEELDPDEFEQDASPGINRRGTKGKKKFDAEFVPLDVPLTKSWDQYYMEILMGFGLVVYILNYFMGRYMNFKIASSWFKLHQTVLESQFELVGDDVLNKNAVSTLEMAKETENIFTLWCSGRDNMDGMFVELHLLKRHDLVSVISCMMKPTRDQTFINITLDDMDPFVMVVGVKKSVLNLQKKMQDVADYCTDRTCSGEKHGLKRDLMIASEIGSEVGNILDIKVRKVIEDYEKFFEYLHISDQFSGPKPTLDEPSTERPETSKKLILALNMQCEKRNPMQADIVKMVPLMRMALYLADRVRRLKLGKESKLKAEKHRQKIEAAFLKQTHSKRQEEAQLKREEKDKAMKERIMNEEDPNKLRKLEDLQQKREARKRDKKLFRTKQMRAKM